MIPFPEMEFLGLRIITFFNVLDIHLQIAPEKKSVPLYTEREALESTDTSPNPIMYFFGFNSFTEVNEHTVNCTYVKCTL